MTGRVLYPARIGSQPRAAEQERQDDESALSHFERRKSSLKKYLVEQYDNYKCQGAWYGYLWTFLEALIILSTIAASLLAALDFGSRPWGKYLLVATSTTAALSATVIGQFNVKNEWLSKEKGAAQAQLHMVQVENTFFGDPKAMHSLGYVYLRAILLDLSQTEQSFSELGNLNAESDRDPLAVPGGK